MSAIFYYKMISKVAINEDYISITLKKLDENALPPYFFLCYKLVNTILRDWDLMVMCATTTLLIIWKNLRINSPLFRMLKRISSISTSRRRTFCLMKKSNFWKNKSTHEKAKPTLSSFAKSVQAVSCSKESLSVPSC